MGRESRGRHAPDVSHPGRDASHWTVGFGLGASQSVAKRMGQLEEERARLLPGATPAAEIVKARLAWIRVMNAFLANADVAGIDEATERLVFGPLRAAEKAASNRGKSKPAETTTAHAGQHPRTLDGEPRRPVLAPRYAS